MLLDWPLAIKCIFGKHEIALKEGRLVIVDELDVGLHPKLLPYVIRLFTNPEINKNAAQLLFTSHDISSIWKAGMGADPYLKNTLNLEI